MTKMSLKNIMFCCLFCMVQLPLLIAAPVVLSLSPNKGILTGGNCVVISGCRFTGATNVNFGFRPAATFNVLNDKTIIATVPPGTVGIVHVTVTVGIETSHLSSKDFYTYTATGWDGIVSVLAPDEVRIFDTTTNTFDAAIPLPGPSLGSVITPDGTRIYTVDTSSATVTVIDAATNSIIATIPTGAGLGGFDIIVNPSGTRIYTSNNATGFVTVIDTATNTVIANIPAGLSPGPLSITPDGSIVFVGDFFLGQVTVIDTATNMVVNAIPTGFFPGLTSITPDGKKAFVGILFSDTVLVIDVATQTVINSINLPPNSGPYGSSLLPDGLTLYVVNINNDSVSIIDVATETITGNIPLTPGSRPFWAAATPDGKTVYVINETNDLVTPIDVATNTPGTPFGGLGGFLQDIVISPDPAPLASFKARTKPNGITIFNASTSLSPVGTIVSYAWDFGDGTMVVTASPLIKHIYTTPGLFNVTLTVTNSAGTSTTKVFSSRFMSNNGGPTATKTKRVRAKPRCHFRLQH